MSPSQFSKFAETEIETRFAVRAATREGYGLLVKIGIEPEPVSGVVGPDHVNAGDCSVSSEVVCKKSDFSRSQALWLRHSKRQHGLEVGIDLTDFGGQSRRRVDGLTAEMIERLSVTPEVP